MKTVYEVETGKIILVQRAPRKVHHKLVEKYPDDWDAAALFSEALMNTMPWDYWSDKGQPKPATREVFYRADALRLPTSRKLFF